MSKITSIKIENFKFFKEELLEIKDGKNLLIYGENGSGKSSFYHAVKYFAYKRAKEDYTADESKYKNIMMQEDDIGVSFTPSNLNFKYSFFINYQILQNIIESKDLFQVIYRDLDFEFQILFSEVFALMKSLEDNIKIETRDIKIVQNLKRDINDALRAILDSLKSEANKTIEAFGEKLQIDFDYEDLLLNVETKGVNSFEFPQIKIKLVEPIDVEPNIYLNEARGKAISLSLYLAMMKLSLQNASETDTKLLVLDDFLLSFDMGNRSFIMKYIFENFGDFQMIILTHNLLFYELVKKLYISFGIQNKWLEMKLYPRENIDGSIEAKIYLQSLNYLDKAKNELKKDNPDLDIAGNNTRKALEKIIYEISIFLEIGSIKLENIIKNIKKSDTFSINGVTLNTTTLNKVLCDSQFFKDIALNAMSHNNTNDFYKSEIEAAINNVDEIFKIYKQVQGGEL